MRDKKTVLLFCGLLLAVTVISSVLIGLLSFRDSNISVRLLNVTNVTDTSFTVTWVSDDKYASNLVYQEGESWPIIFSQFGKSFAWDDRDVELSSEGVYIQRQNGLQPRYTHHVTVRNLKPDTVYSFRIAGSINGKEAEVKSVKTNTLFEDINTPNPGYGKVEGIEAEDSIILLASTDPTDEFVRPISTPISSSSTYSVDMNLYDFQGKQNRAATILSGKDYYLVHKFTSTEFKPFETIVAQESIGQDNSPLSPIVYPIFGEGIGNTITCTNNTTQNIRVRETASTNGVIKYAIAPGKSVKITGETETANGYTWGKVVGYNEDLTSIISSRDGWVAKSIANFNCGSSSTPIAPTTPVVPPSVERPTTPQPVTGDWSCDDLGGEVNYTVNTSVLNVRQDTQVGAVKASLNRGTTLSGCNNSVAGAQPAGYTTNTWIKIPEQQAYAFAALLIKNGVTTNTFSNAAPASVDQEPQIASTVNPPVIPPTTVTREVPIGSGNRDLTPRGKLLESNGTAIQASVSRALAEIDLRNGPDDGVPEITVIAPNCLAPGLSEANSPTITALGGVKESTICMYPSNSTFTNNGRTRASCGIVTSGVLSHGGTFSSNPAFICLKSFDGGSQPDNKTIICYGGACTDEGLHFEEILHEIHTRDFGLNRPTTEALVNIARSGAAEGYQQYSRYAFTVDGANRGNIAATNVYILNAANQPNSGCSAESLVKLAFGVRDEGCITFINNIDIKFSNPSALVMPGPNLIRGIAAQPAKDSITVDQGGVYNYFANQVNRTVNIDLLEGQQAEVRFFNDLNNNGIKDAGEEFISDVSTISLQKESSSISYSLNAGWNLIHIPLLFDKGDFTAEDLFLEIGARRVAVNHVAKFQGGKFDLYSRREDGSRFNENFKIYPGMGLFVFVESPVEFTLNGKLPEQDLKAVTLENGWNLVGFWPLNVRNSEQVIDQGIQGSNVNIISQFENGVYRSQVSDEGLTYGSSFNISDRRGYFVRVESLTSQ
jgi:hypothetical protein